MELNEYQEKAMTTCMESSNNIPYMFYNLLGEVGELVDKIKGYVVDAELIELSNLLAVFGAMAKLIRKEPENLVVIEILKEYEKYKDQISQNVDIQKECGDIAWQLSGLCSVLGWKFNDIGQQNLDKLKSRQQRGKIDGNGDNR